ncbi:MAG: hypothetical protein ABIO61_10195 [Thermomonas sp.]
MLRKLLLPILVTAAISGCATDYNYRGGNGDYYYGQPRVEYRTQGSSGYYGNFGYGYGGNYYYDRFGRVVYGAPGGYYGYPYYGGNGWYRPRPHRGHGDRDDHDTDDGPGDHQNRPPPWRDLGGLQDRDENGDGAPGQRQRPMRPGRPTTSSDALIRTQRTERSPPVIRERNESSSRMGGFIEGATRSRDKRNPTPQD